MSKVSIIIPTFNAERWLKETLISAVNQTWADKEIIFVDDGSTDRSVEIARSFESPTFKIIEQKNSGPGTARNRGLREAQGEHIQFLDHDDLLSLDKIEEQVRILQENPRDTVALCGAIYFPDGVNPSRLQVERGWPAVDTEDPLDWVINLLGEHGTNGMIPTNAWLTPRNLIEAAGPWETAQSPDDDGEYFCRVVLASKRIRTTKDGFVMHRKFPDASNLGAAKTEELHWAALRSLNLKRDHVLSRTDDSRARRGLARCYVHRAFLAYPNYPGVTTAAVNAADELGGSDWNPFPTKPGRMISQVFGWKLTRKASLAYHRFTSAIKRASLSARTETPDSISVVEK